MPQQSSADIARFNMVEGQLRPNRVTNPALVDAFLHLPRERFLPPEKAALAYGDEDVPLNKTRYAMEPRILGRLIQEAALDPTDVVLDVGCGTGYATALMARLAGMVVGIESDTELAQQANAHLAELEIDNAAIMVAPLEKGCMDQGPYHVILVNGAVSEIPESLVAQLGEGGRMLTVLRPSNSAGQAVMVRRFGQSWSVIPLFDAHTPYLEGFAPQPQFVF